MIARRRRARQGRAAAAKVERLAAGKKPIVAGPWLGGIDAELLYWIPLLRWLTEEGGVDPRRIVAISRDGADAWYEGLAGQYIDLLDHFPPGEETRDSQVQSFAKRQAARLKGDVLSPAILATLVAARSATGLNASALRAHAVHRFLPSRRATFLNIPQPYAALVVDFNDHFPDTEQHRRFVRELLHHLGTQGRVALLGASAPQASVRVIADGKLERAMQIPEREQLAVQTDVVRNAEVLFSTYGGLAAVGPYVDTPTVAFYSEPTLDVAQLDELAYAGQELSRARTLFRARHAGQLAAAFSLGSLSES